MAAVLSALAAAAADAGAGGAETADAAALGAISPQQIARIVPGHTAKADVLSMLGKPWRVVQFNDCGMAMDGQADETWEYRGADPSGGYRLHVEFGDDGMVSLIAKVPNNNPGGAATQAKVAPAQSAKGMSM